MSSLRDTWVSMFEPERYPPPPLSGASLAWRYGAALVGFFFMVGAYLVAWEARASGLVFGEEVSPAELGELPPVWFMVLDGVCGVVGLGIIHLRRRWPLAIFLAVSALAVVSGSASVVALWSLVSLASRRDLRNTLIGVALGVGMSLASHLFPWAVPFSWRLLVATLVSMLAFALVGMYIGVRRDRAGAFLRRVEQAEEDRSFAVLAERNRIAREMHDVLAHRISLVSMHAGVLAYRTDLTPEKAREVAHVIQENAHASLSELRSVLSTLRSDDAVAAPQPTLAALPALLAEAEASGLQLQVTDTLDVEHLPLVQQRHLYRIVQECLTNARKHAPREVVELALSGGRREGVTLRVTNPMAAATAGIPGARLGLVGITERAQMMGGRLTAGVQGGRFVVEAWLPWEYDYRRQT